MKEGAQADSGMCGGAGRGSPVAPSASSPWCRCSHPRGRSVHGGQLRRAWLVFSPWVFLKGMVFLKRESEGWSVQESLDSVPGRGVESETEENISMVRLPAMNRFLFPSLCFVTVWRRTGVARFLIKGLTEEDSDWDHPALLPCPLSACPLVSRAPGFGCGHKWTDMAPSSRSPHHRDKQGKGGG